jgi:hypothetical protein
VTAESEREAAIEQLEEALRADDEDATTFHVKEAIQLLHVAEQTASTERNSTNERAE